MKDSVCMQTHPLMATSVIYGILPIVREYFFFKKYCQCIMDTNSNTEGQGPLSASA